MNLVRSARLTNPKVIDVVHLFYSIEGILVDLVYTSKAMASLVGLIQRGCFMRAENVLFVHTDRTPELFAYQAELSTLSVSALSLG